MQTCSVSRRADTEDRRHGCGLEADDQCHASVRRAFGPPAGEHRRAATEPTGGPVGGWTEREHADRARDNAGVPGREERMWSCGMPPFTRGRVCAVHERVGRWPCGRARVGSIAVEYAVAHSDRSLDAIDVATLSRLLVQRRRPHVLLDVDLVELGADLRRAQDAPSLLELIRVNAHSGRGHKRGTRCESEPNGATVVGIDPPKTIRSVELTDSAEHRVVVIRLCDRWRRIVDHEQQRSWMARMGRTRGIAELQQQRRDSRDGTQLAAPCRREGRPHCRARDRPGSARQLPRDRQEGDGRLDPRRTRWFSRSMRSPIRTTRRSSRSSRCTPTRRHTCHIARRLTSRNTSRNEAHDHVAEAQGDRSRAAQRQAVSKRRQPIRDDVAARCASQRRPRFEPTATRGRSRGNRRRRAAAHQRRYRARARAIRGS